MAEFALESAKLSNSAMVSWFPSYVGDSIRFPALSHLRSDCFSKHDKFIYLNWIAFKSTSGLRQMIIIMPYDPYSVNEGWMMIQTTQSIIIIYWNQNKYVFFYTALYRQRHLLKAFYNRTYDKEEVFSDGLHTTMYNS